MPRHPSWMAALAVALCLSAPGADVPGSVVSGAEGAADPPAAAVSGAASVDAGREAVRLMARSLVSIRDLRRARGLGIDRALDPNETGIVGGEFTSLTTTAGDAEAKRTAANPAFAAAIVRYFQEAGLRRGDVVAVGASGSFPAFILATLSATRALGLDPIIIYSVGSSMYGANLPGFTFVDMLARLREDGVLPYEIAAVAAGGERDSGKGVLFDEEGTSLIDEARRSGRPVVGGRSLAENIRERLRLFEAAAGTRPIGCFVNVGGASANFGDTPASLLLPNGLVRRVARVPDSPTRGLVFEFAARGIPVVHLLYVRGLAQANGLPYPWGQVLN